MSAFIIVIDDSPTICKVIETCLHRAGYEVKSFADGVLAIKWLVSPEARIPALIFVDLGLPKLDGYAVIQHLKTKPICEQTVFVILSRRDSIIDKIKGRLVGARGYLTKPCKTQELVAIVQAFVGVECCIAYDPVPGK